MTLSVAFPRLSSGGVVLRAFGYRDVETVQAAATDPHIPRITTVPSSGTRESALEYIVRQHQRVVDGTGYSFAITHEETDRAVGQIGLWLRDYDDGRASIGYWIAPDERRRGFASDALDALSEWALSHDGIARLELYVEPWNEASWRTAERCGYVREGLLRSWQQVGDELRDMFMYSRIR